MKTCTHTGTFLIRLDTPELNRQTRREHEVRFDITKCFALMSRFHGDAVDVFLEAFERIAAEGDWPQSEWVTLVRREFADKDQEAYVALAVHCTEY